MAGTSAGSAAAFTAAAVLLLSCCTTFAGYIIQDPSRRSLQVHGQGLTSGANAACQSVCGGPSQVCLGYSVDELCIVQCLGECDCSRWSGDTCDCNPNDCDDIDTGIDTAELPDAHGHETGQAGLLAGCAGIMPIMDKRHGCDASCVGLYFIDHMGGLCAGCMEDGTVITAENEHAIVFGHGARTKTLAGTACKSQDACDSWCECCRCVQHLHHTVDHCEKQGLDCRCLLGAEEVGPCPDLQLRALAVTDACCECEPADKLSLPVLHFQIVRRFAQHTPDRPCLCFSDDCRCGCRHVRDCHLHRRRASDMRPCMCCGCFTVLHGWLL